MKADVHWQTAKKYIQAGKSPEQLQQKHDWRTRVDPLEKIWPQAAAMLHDAPELEATTLFEHFLAQPDSGLEEQHLRTFQRRVRHWPAHYPHLFYLFIRSVSRVCFGVRGQRFPMIERYH